MYACARRLPVEHYFSTPPPISQYLAVVDRFGIRPHKCLPPSSGERGITEDAPLRLCSSPNSSPIPHPDNTYRRGMLAVSTACFLVVGNSVQGEILKQTGSLEVEQSSIEC